MGISVVDSPLSPVLRFPWPHAEGRNQLLLWPVYGWHVVAPKPSHKQLDLFERAALGLCRAGIIHYETIAKRLMIGRELSKYLLIGLQQRGFIDTSGKPTTKGLKLLDEDEISAPNEDIIGTVFSDPWDGKLWPYFHSGVLPFVESEPNEKGHLELIGGTIGAPKRQRAFTVYPPKGAIRVQPEPEQILKAIRSHRRQYQYHEDTTVADAPWLKRISLIENKPSRFFLVMRLRANEARWVADDPFGFGESLLARDRVKNALDSSEPLRLSLKELTSRDDTSVDFQALQDAAERKIEEILSRAIRNHPDLYDRLAAMQRALMEAEQKNAPADKWNDVAVKAQIVLERLLRMIQQQGLDALSVLEGLSQDENFNKELLDSISKSFGFQTPLPETLSKVRRGKVIHALEYGKGSLGPLTLATLLVARNEPQHPLRLAATTAPDLLLRLDRAARLRDPASHDSDVPVAPKRAQEVAEDVFQIVKTLIHGVIL